MRPVTVYRVDFGWKTKEPIGVVLEMRKKERSNNNYDLLRLARRLFASGTADAADIIIDVRPARDRDHGVAPSEGAVSQR
ncbi:MAG: hypothetical protein IH611_10945 [Deltaproteobacteria bacterium]|nr:hypothetical protein [Deltaproteobacteria bacterium]